MAEVKVEDFIVGEAPTLSKEPRESTSEDYYNTVNPVGLVYNNPSLRYNTLQDDSNSLDMSDPIVSSVYEGADIETKREMIQARSASHALKIYERRKIFADSQRSIDADGLGRQLLMGALPALASPTSAIPFAGVAGKAFQVGKQVTRAMHIATVSATGAVSGAAANVIDEAVLGEQGLDTHMLSAGLIGLGFGGTLGLIGGALSGTHAISHARAMSREGDTFTKDFDMDPNIRTEVDENGIIKIVDVNPEMTVVPGRQGKFGTDYIPFIGKFLRSDVNTVFQSNSSVLRGEMTKLSGSTVALKDVDGNVITTPWNAVNDLKTSDGVYMKFNKQ
ncbi:MAG: hypothetical protein DRP62_08830, partial [Planctomycetota bacterium]